MEGWIILRTNFKRCWSIWKYWEFWRNYPLYLSLTGPEILVIDWFLSRKLLTLSVSRPNGRNWITGRPAVRINVISEKRLSWGNLSPISDISWLCFYKIYLALDLPKGGLTHLPNVGATSGPIGRWHLCSQKFLFQPLRPNLRTHSGEKSNNCIQQCGYVSSGDFWTNWALLTFIFAQI